MLNKILLLFACLILLIISWGSVLSMRSAADKQNELMKLANTEIANETYINAVSYLREAVGYATKETYKAYEMLKTVYYELENYREYERTLRSMLTLADSSPDIYLEYADYLLDRNKTAEALDVLKQGIELFNDEALIDLYNKYRYTYTIGSSAYDDVTAYLNNCIQVKKGEYWGIADIEGKIIIPCSYEHISSYDRVNNQGRAVVMRPDGEVITINTSGYAVARYDNPVKQIGSLSQNRIPMQLEDGQWVLARIDLTHGDRRYEDISTVANSAIAVKDSGQWGVVMLNGDVIAPYEYDEIITDELKRCYAQNAVFAKKGGAVYLIADGTVLPETYEDAKPFTDRGPAAVKNNGKWGFADTSGNLLIDYQYDDAASFSMGLAAVKTGENWGYIDINNQTAIEPVFYGAKNFVNGSAPVLTQRGWQFITLIEYK